MKAWIIWIARALCAGSLLKKEALIDSFRGQKTDNSFWLLAIWQIGKKREKGGKKNKEEGEVGDTRVAGLNA